MPAIYPLLGNTEHWVWVAWSGCRYDMPWWYNPDFITNSEHDVKSLMLRSHAMSEKTVYHTISPFSQTQNWTLFPSGSRFAAVKPRTYIDQCALNQHLTATLNEASSSKSSIFIHLKNHPTKPPSFHFHSIFVINLLIHFYAVLL